MDTINYLYKGKSWKESSTVSDKNSFFHAAFGVRANLDEPYLDKKVKFRRSRWTSFLIYFEDEIMPPRLIDVLKTCFFAIEKYKHASVEDQDHLEGYVSDITRAEHDVTMEEILILATLENVNVVLFKDEVSEPTVISPNDQILGSYPNAEKPKGEVVLYKKGNTFSRMNPLVEDHIPKPTENEGKTVGVTATKESEGQRDSGFMKYKKGGSAGSEGVQFQVGLLTIFFLNAVQKLENWKLSTENTAAGKFDDAVIEWPEGAVLLQAKHKQNSKKKITLEELVSTNSKNDDFSIPKYFLSYEEIKKTFKLKEVIICTNASVDGKAMKFLKAQKVDSESMLHYEKCDCNFYTFNDTILSYLQENIKSYYEKNFQNKGVDASAITEENIKEFLAHLQLFFNYPPGNNVKKVTKRLMSHMRLLYIDVSPLDIYTKLLDWFQRKDGVYITELYAKAIFSEIWTDKRWQKLEKYEISFQHNHLNFQNSKRLFHVIAKGMCLLQEIKIFQTLQSNKTKFLFANPHDGTAKHKQIIEAFAMPQYTILVLVSPKFAQEFELNETSCKLTEILDKFGYKKVVLVADYNNKIPQLIGLGNDNYDIINESITLGDLSKYSQMKLLEKENIIFQENHITMKELFAGQVSEHYGNFLDTAELEKLVRDEKIKVGAPLLELGEDIMQFYVNRNFKRIKYNDEEVKSAIGDEIFSEELICELKEKVVVISDAAGTGKSTVLTNLAATMKKKYPHLWVILIDLNNYTKILKVFLEKNKKTINIQELLDSRHSTKLTNQLERTVFSMNEKVVLMLDGFDEISPDYTQLILSLLCLSRDQQNCAKIIITTRPHVARELREKLHIEPFVMEPFTGQDQIGFLTAYWMVNLNVGNSERDKCEEYANALIRKVSSWVRLFEQGAKHFAAIPLHVRMLAEIFQENNQFEISGEWKGCREYLVGDEIELKLPENMNVTKLYKMFIDKKRIVFIDKGNPIGNTAANQALIEQFEECLAYHKNLALDLLLDETKRELFSCRQKTRRNVEMNVLKMGIVQKVNNLFQFVHRTFAEYFVAESLIEELRQSKENIEFQKFLIEEMLLKPQNVIHAFFNSFLQQAVDDLPSDTFYQRVSYKITSVNDNFSFSLNIIVLNGHLATFQLILKCLDPSLFTNPESPIQFFKTPDEENIPEFSNILNVMQQVVLKEDRIGETFLENAAASGNLEMVKFLVEQGANVNIGELKPLHVAVRDGHLEVAKFLIEHGADITAKDTRYGTTALYKAVLRDDCTMAIYLVDRMFHIEGLNIIHSVVPYTAAYFGVIDFFEKIWLRQGLNVNRKVENDETVLFGAVRGGQLETVRYLVRQGCDINGRNRDGNTVLHITSSNLRLLLTADLLVELGINVDVRNLKLSTALHIAAEENNYKLVQLLVNCGADVNLEDVNRNTALHIAAQNLRGYVVKLLVEHGTNINSKNKDGCTALHLAIEQSCIHFNKFRKQSVSNLNLIIHLIENDADVNIKNPNGHTILHLASKMDAVYIIIQLMESLGVDANITDNEGRTALHLAALEDHTRIVKFLLQYNADSNMRDKYGYTVLHYLSIGSPNDDDRSEVFRLAIENCKDVNLKGSGGRTALHLAARWGNLDFVILLVEHGADINIRDAQGLTGLYLAAREGHFDVVEYLSSKDRNIDDGVKHHFMYLDTEYREVDIKDETGCTALHFAILKGHLKTVKSLLQRGADINNANGDGYTALHIAASMGQLVIAKFFFEWGVDVDVRDDKGHTALHLAAEKGQFDIVVCLVESGCDVDARDEKNNTALHKAVSKGHFDTAEYLVASGVDIRIRNDQGYTALHLASKGKNSDVWFVRRDTSTTDDSSKGASIEEDMSDIIKLLEDAESATGSETYCTTSEVDFNSSDGDSDVEDYENMNEYFNEILEDFTDSFEERRFNLDIIKTLLTRCNEAVDIKDKAGRTTLHLAVLEGNLEVVQTFVQYGANINIQNIDGRTALHMAAREGHFEIVKFLVECGEDKDVRDMDGRTPLHLAVEKDAFDVVVLLVAFGADIDAGDNTGSTALHKAVSKGYFDTVKYLVEAGIDIKIRNNRGYTALHLAVKSSRGSATKNTKIDRICDTNFTASHEEIAVDANNTACDLNALLSENSRATFKKLNASDNFTEEPFNLRVIKILLVRCNEVVDIKNESGHTALHLAVSADNLEIVKLLVQHGTDVNNQDCYGRTALHIAALENHVEIAKFLLDWGVDEGIRDNDVHTTLHLAVEKGALDIVVLLMEHGVDVDASDGMGNTALHTAVSKGYVDIAKYLTKSGSDIRLRNNRGYTALHLAAERGDLDTVIFFADLDVDVNVTDNHGYTALQLALDESHLNVVKYLIEMGADIRGIENYEHSMLYLAAKSEELDIMTFFMKRCTNVNITDKNGNTALHSVVCKNNLDVVEFLVGFGIDLNIKNNEGRTALHIASDRDRLKIANFLVQHGADLNIVDNQGNTALHLAATSSLNFVTFLVEQGADVYLEDANGDTAAIVAKKKGRIAVFNYLQKELSLKNRMFC